MLASRGLREDDNGKISRLAQEFDVAVRRQARKVMMLTVVFAFVLLGVTAAAAMVVR